MTPQHTGFHAVAPRLYVAVWAALVICTSITVSVSFLDMQRFTVFTAMVIATVKAGLVLLYFMHIRFEKPLFAVMILFVLATYAIFIILMFSDYSFR
jgi:cytochrome c oxidase subunit IV